MALLPFGLFLLNQFVLKNEKRKKLSYSPSYLLVHKRDDSKNRQTDRQTDRQKETDTEDNRQAGSKNNDRQ